MKPERAILTEMVRPQIEAGLGDCFQPPSPDAHKYGNNKGKDPCGSFDHKGAVTKQVEVGRGLWVAGQQLLCRRVEKTRNVQTEDTQPALKKGGGRSTSSSSSIYGGGLKGSLKKRKRTLSKDSLIAMARAILGVRTEIKTVTFSEVYEVCLSDNIEYIYSMQRTQGV